MEKVCRKCSISKSLSDYDPHKGTKDKLTQVCKKCRGDASTVARVKKKYGVTADRYNELLAKQQNTCAICKTPYAGSYPNSKTKRFAVDHNHQTSAIRGLLCSCCNTGLGQFKDNIELLQAAINYLESQNGSQGRN